MRSTLMALLEHARSETGRGSRSGEVEDELRTGSWLGATAYFILLDQIGKCLKPTNAPAPAGPSAIERALQMWSAVSRDEQYALTALRHALTHDFALSNQNARNPVYQHRFTLDRDPDRLVHLPAERWSGDYHSTKQDTTIVSLRALGDLVERIVVGVMRAAEADAVEIILPGGSAELMMRYGVVHRSAT